MCPMSTRREEIAQFLRRRPGTVKDVAAQFGLRHSLALDDVEHVRMSNRENFVIEPARCRHCGFEFTDRERLSTPSRCPKCRAERIDGPWFHIEQ
jgi:predicted Zn-ribbon and HTH transcriptional regulator